jgi:Mrp family chromosome partitioning ATPase
MRIRVEQTAGAVGARLVDPENFTDFAVELAVAAEAAGAALAGRVELAGEQAWVDEPWLRELGAYDADGRREPYQRMLGYARDHGWVDARGRIGAHIVQTGQ